MGKDYESELEFVSNFYGIDFCKLELEAQLKTLYTEKCGTEEATVSSVKAVLQDLNSSQRTLLDMVCLALKLLLVMPAMNCTTERSFSTLKV